MSNRLSSFVMIVSLSITACNTIRQESQVKEITGVRGYDNVGHIDCGGGELSYFVMTAVENPEKYGANSFPLVENAPKARMQVEDFSLRGTNFIRLETCMKNGKLSLERIVTSDNGSIYRMTTLSPGSTVEGLEEALFADEISKLNIVTVNGKVLTLIQGDQTGKAVIWGNFRLSGSEPREGLETPLPFLVGKFEFKEPDLSGSCESISSLQWNESITTSEGRVDMHFWGKPGQGTSGGAYPKACALEVVDSSPALKLMAGKPVKIEFGYTDSEIYTHINTHHVSGDAIIFKTPHAQYSFVKRDASAVITSKIFDKTKLPALPNNYRIDYGSKVIQGRSPEMFADKFGGG